MKTISCNVVQMKSGLTAAAADARKMVRKTWSATETFFDGVSYSIKREPFKAVGITFGVALGLGALTGWFANRK
jgi:ElaB/YqjD/DUF883 family membrane-anchored ribosome-binding protein